MNPNFHYSSRLLITLASELYDLEESKGSHMNTKLVAACLTLAAGLGGTTLAPAASAAEAATMASVAQTARAAPGFYAGGIWQFYQSNGAVVTVNVTQDENGRLYGSAANDGASGTIEEGWVFGTEIYFVIGWWNGSRGRCVGTLGADRHLSGTSVDLTHPESQATWFTARRF
jgi:hypothetical protein